MPRELLAEQLLRERFGFPSFLDGQQEVVRSVLAGRDTLAVMPTGGGKSLGYALPALLLERPVLVVSPLIALMKDQADRLRAKGIPVGVINSTVPPEEQRALLAALRAHSLRLLFVAPERFRSDRFLRALEGFVPGLFAVDEAHCISEWGHDFRPDYRRLADALQYLGRPPVLALTATATEEVRRDIAASLRMRQPNVLVKGFERKNLEFVVRHPASSEERFRACLEEVERGGTGILYAVTRKQVEEATARLRGAGVRAGFYHAGLSDNDRRKVQERFSDRTLPVVVATNAFGMGIDRADVRFVVHLGLPGSVEAYTQEAGRAGRDGKPARCVLLHQPADVRLQRFFIETAWPPEAVVRATLQRVRSFGAGALVDEACLAPPPDSDTHPRMIDSALRILEQGGAVARVMDGRGRCVRHVGEGCIDFAQLRARAERDYQRLQHMIEYAERVICHRAWLVNYFAGAGTAPDCGACDGCRAHGRRRVVAGDDLQVVRAALDCVRALSGRFGRRRLAALLAGSRAKDLLDSGLARNFHYGRLRQYSQDFVDRLLKECLAQGLLRVDGGEYPVVSLTVEGIDALQGRRDVVLSCFEAPAPRPEPPRKARAHRRDKRPAHGQEPAAPAGPVDPAVLQRLKRWRREQAEREGVPAYVVFHDRVLDELARRRPSDRASLLQVKGIGPAKIERYGDALLELLQGAGAAHDASA